LTPTAHAAQARVYQQAAQSRQPRHTDWCRAGAGLLIATLLRYSDSGKYDFASAYHIPTFLFLTLNRGDVPWPDQQRR
jgi:hypothetical protein